MTQTLSSGTPGSGDAVYVLRELDNSPRLAVKAVKPGGTITYNGGTAALDFVTRSPFEESNPTLGGTYTIANDAPTENVYNVNGYSENYKVVVNASGADSATLNWDSNSGRLRVSQATSGKIFFVRKESFDTEEYEGEIKISVNTYPTGYTGDTQLSVPSSQSNGYWEPGVTGGYVLEVLEAWPDPEYTGFHGEETGSDEGDLVVNLPPPA